ncbi:MAG TPA: hypothetical protein VN025_09820 [Candidatus Dormibacteraeota bacterium]|jgi:hypothetical protein|nr:hypothetical protein [Candidatus Dormibacteraeota bacterium]
MKLQEMLALAICLAAPVFAGAAPCKVVITQASHTMLPGSTAIFKAEVVPASCSQAITWTAPAGSVTDGSFHAPLISPIDSKGTKHVVVIAKQTDAPHASATVSVSIIDTRTNPSQPIKPVSPIPSTTVPSAKKP